MLIDRLWHNMTQYDTHTRISSYIDISWYFDVYSPIFHVYSITCIMIYDVRWAKVRHRRCWGGLDSRYVQICRDRIEVQSIASMVQIGCLLGLLGSTSLPQRLRPRCWIARGSMLLYCTCFAYQIPMLHIWGLHHQSHRGCLARA